jgi:D-alanyl-D-alanine carboxypeptidase
MKYKLKKWCVLLLTSIGILIFCFIIFLYMTNQNKSTVPANNQTTQQTQLPKPKKDELLTLVNYQNQIPDNWQVDLVQLNNGQSIDKRAYPDLQQMMDDARAQGLSPFICSSYRTQAKQQKLFNNEVMSYQQQSSSQEEAEEKASFWVARPGTSEHQMGLAVDIVATSHQLLDESQEKTAEQQWLIENCYKYGFILRYPNDKNQITKVGYEPWHYRYVGKEHAKTIMQEGICLEEYLDKYF